MALALVLFAVAYLAGVAALVRDRHPIDAIDSITDPPFDRVSDIYDPDSASI